MAYGWWQATRQQKNLSHPPFMFRGMDTTLMAEDLEIDGPVVECPLCGGIIDLLGLTVDWAGFDPPNCSDCGVVLAA